MNIIIKYDNAEWDNGAYVLYLKGKEVDRIYADELVEDFMRNNNEFEYKEVK